MKRSTLYWVCQFAGWGFLLAFFTAMTLIFSEEEVTPGFIQLQIIILISMIGFTHLFRLYVKKKDWQSLKVKVLIPRILLGGIVVAIASEVFIFTLIYVIIPLEGIWGFSIGGFIRVVVNVSPMVWIWSAIYFAYHFIESKRKTELEKLELRAALNEAELAILKNQVNPHFLFNALNNIRSLILSDPHKARTMVTHISELLRYSIQFNASERVTLGQEIEIVKDYLQLESIQYNDRLTYSFDIDDSALGIKIPPMAIQLLVENAIKHGISQLSTGGEINIQAQLENEHLKIQVTNDGQLIKKSKREGVGLRNLVERLKILFGQFAELSIENSSEDKVTASLKIPLT